MERGHANTRPNHWSYGEWSWDLEVFGLWSLAFGLRSSLCIWKDQRPKTKDPRPKTDGPLEMTFVASLRYGYYDDCETKNNSRGRLGAG